MYSRKLPKNSYEEFFYKVNYFFSYLSPTDLPLSSCVCVLRRGAWGINLVCLKSGCPPKSGFRIQKRAGVPNILQKRLFPRKFAMMIRQIYHIQGGKISNFTKILLSLQDCIWKTKEVRVYCSFADSGLYFTF